MTETVNLNGRSFKVVASPRAASHPSPPPAKPVKPGKYRNRKVVLNGETFDSQKEADRHLVLIDRQARGEIHDLKRQVTFKLMVAGQKIGSVRPDWTYIERGKPVAEDAKGYQTASHKTRWKLARACYPNVEWRLS